MDEFKITASLISLKLKMEINKIPEKLTSSDGFWKQSTKEVFIKTAKKLAKKGFSEKDILGILEDLYSAVSEEYGN